MLKKSECSLKNGVYKISKMDNTTNKAKPINIDEFDVSKLQCAKKKKSTIKLLYEMNPVQFQTCAMYTPFGVRRDDTKHWLNHADYSIGCSLSQSASAPAVKFATFLEQVDDGLRQLITDDPQELFAGKSEEGVELVYNPIMRSNNDYPKLMTMQLPRDSYGNFMTVVFDEKKEKIMLTESNISSVLSKGCLFKCIISCEKVWVYKGRVGTIWNIMQMKLVEKKKVASSPERPEDTSSAYTSMMLID